jgi:O-succinylbenzoate synthase
VYSGAVVGLSNSALVLAEVKSCVEAGYQRIKLKIAPGGSVPAVQAVRRAFPDVLITLDANQSFTMHHLSELRAFDKLNVGWIEEPLNMKALGLHTGEQAIARLASFQRSLSSPLCVDESFVNAREAQHFFDHPELRFAAIKVGKFGGIQPALEFVHRAVCEGREVCLSGMYDTGVSRYVHAAFQTLPGVVMPGDLGATSRYFNESITVPPYTAPHGVITLNTPGHEYGIGCEVDRSFTTFNQIFT